MIYYLNCENMFVIKMCFKKQINRCYITLTFFKIFSSMVGILFGVLLVLFESWDSPREGIAVKESSCAIPKVPLKMLFFPLLLILSLSPFYILAMDCTSKHDCNQIHSAVFFVPVSLVCQINLSS